MSVLQFLAALPAALGIAGFVIYYFLLRTRQGDRVTLDIVAKLRKTAPDALPADTRLDSVTLARLIENDAAFRSKVSEQDFQLLRDALRQQFVGSLFVYSICGIIFFAGIAIYAYVSTRPTPLSIASVAAQSVDPKASGLPVDLDTLRVNWTASGQQEDMTVTIEEMSTHARTGSKSVRSSEGRIDFTPQELRPVLKVRDYKGKNRLRAVFQTSNASFTSPEFEMAVGVTILAVHIEPLRIKIAGMIDNRAIDGYDFEAKLLIWAQAQGKAPAPITYGGNIHSVSADIPLDPALTYDWATAKLTYFGPDDLRTVRTDLLGFQ